jgi:LysM repeat protein
MPTQTVNRAAKTDLQKPTAAPAPTSNYTVNKGDNLSTLAKNWGVSVADIMKSNQGIKDPNKIGIGQKLVRPGATGNPVYQHGIGTKAGPQSTQNMFKK